MSSNIVKGGYVHVVDEKKITIDNNELIRKKLEEIKSQQLQILNSQQEEVQEEGFVEGLNPFQVECLVSDDFNSGSGEAGAKNDISGNVIHAAAEYEKRANELVENAKLEAERIVEEAKSQAEAYTEEARSQGYESGYTDGIANAENEIQSHKDQLSAEYDSLKQQLQAEYDGRMAEMEPLLIEKLTQIYEHILGVSLSDSTSTVVFLLKRSLCTMDSNKNYIIHVSAEDFDFVKENKDALSKASGIIEDNIEVIEDHSLSKNGCMIESDGGIFDVGLDTQLSLLNKQLKILSMSVVSEQ